MPLRYATSMVASSRQWIESIGLDQYADAFETNDVDGQVIRSLDHDLLREIGVRSVGHRVRILDAAKNTYNADNPDDSTEHATERLAK